MSNKLQDDITDDEIDALFKDGAVQKNIIQKQQSDIVPAEFSVDNDEDVGHVERPVDPQSQQTAIRREEKREVEEEKKAIEKNIADVKSINNYDNVKIYVNGILKLRSSLKYKDQHTKEIIAGRTKVNIDESTPCKFHLYEISQIMGNIYYCKCRYCSAYKEFNEDEWNEYCKKYRKWF